MPWIYEKEKPEIHEASAYNRRQKGTAFKNNYETRLAMIRKNLSTMDEKIETLRQSRVQNKPNTYDDQINLNVFKVLSNELSAGKFKQQKASLVRAAKKEAEREVGIEARKSTPVRKAGSSRRGRVSKKESEQGGLQDDMREGKDPESEQQ